MSTKTADLHLVDGLHFVARTAGGLSFELDSVPPGVDGTSVAPGPMDLVLSAAGSCMAMDALSILRKMRQQVASYDVHLEAARSDEHPRVFTSITMLHRVAGPDLAATNVARALQLSMTSYCPVYATLRPTVAITVRYEVTDQTTGNVTEGEAEPESVVD